MSVKQAVRGRPTPPPLKATALGVITMGVEVGILMGVALSLGVLVWRMRRVPALRRQSAWLAGLLALQFLTGLSNVVLGWPLIAAVLHTGGAAALVIVLTWAVCESRLAVDTLSASRLRASSLSA